MSFPVNKDIDSRGICRDERGQAMAFGVLTMLFLATFIAMTFDVGVTSHKKLRLQNAADMAAYGAANLEASNLSMVAFVNRGMAFVYYNLMRYAIDCNVLATMKEFKDHKADPVIAAVALTGLQGDGHRKAPDDYIATSSSLASGGGGGIVQMLREAKERWDKEVPDGERWIRSLYELNKGISDATPLLVRLEAHRVGTDNGAERICIYPDYRRQGSSTRLSLNFDPHLDGQEPYVRHESDLNRWVTKIVIGDYWPKNRVGPMHALLYQDIDNHRVPEWFDAKKGEPQGEHAYLQVRECWNKNDIDHDDKHQGVGGWPWFFTPAGHWHYLHVHCIEAGWSEICYPHMDGHTNDGHLPFTSTIPPLYFWSDSHHCIVFCPTCFQPTLEGADQALRWDGDLDGSTDVIKFLKDSDISGKKYRKVRIENFVPHGDKSLAPALVLSRNIFKYGVNVGAWRRKTEKRSFFKKPEWGYFAVASAKAGPVENGKIRVYRKGQESQINSWISSTKNLYHLEWGAKLIPVRDSLMDKSTGHLFRGFVNGRWMMGAWDPIGDPTVNLKLKIMLSQYRSFPVPWNWNDDSRIDDLIKH
ncbi:MAG: pilus assembly protein TadG-related protein [Planctomycetota bacterium]|nr:pilus assembly protein TadG-related protein [Planctomycetota bacterium]